MTSLIAYAKTIRRIANSLIYPKDNHTIGAIRVSREHKASLTARQADSLEDFVAFAPPSYDR